MLYVVSYTHVNGSFRKRWETRVKEKFRQDYVQTATKSIWFWTPVNLMQFYVIPPHFRMIVNALSLACWTCFLSFISHRN